MKKINNYTDFLKENKLRYYGFDWDDNILHMSTIIHMDKLVEGVWHPISISPSEYALLRYNSNYRTRDNNPEKAYEEFRDVGPRASKAFITDIVQAIEEKQFGPSWDKFVKCLTEGALFAIVTARGHEYSTLKEGVKYVIDNCLTEAQQDKMYENCEKFLHLFEKRTYTRNNSGNFTENELIKYYLDKCKYYGVGTPLSESFKSEFNVTNTIKIEEAKKLALNKFLEICHSYGEKTNIKVSVGFSDDDKKNVEHVKKFFEFKSAVYDRMKLNVYDTSNKTSVKTKFENGIVEDMGQSITGTENSLLRFTGFNTLPNDLGNTTTDFSQPNYTLLQKAKVAQKLTRTPKKKFNKKIKNAKPKSNDNPA
jgi:hypothetical protein